MWILQNGSQTFRLGPDAIRTVGRSARADFRVDGALLSRLHCRLDASAPNRLLVQDLQSTNGTFVNDRRVASSALVAGDRLRLGSVELLVEWVE